MLDEFDEPVIGDPDGPFASVTLAIRSHPPSGAVTHYSSTIEREHGENVSGLPGGNLVRIPFTYGEPFNVSVSLFARVTTDNVYKGFINNRSIYGGGDVQFVQADFSHTLSIDALAIPDEAAISGLSGFDYQHLVTPEPGRTLQVVAALVSLALLRRRAMSCSRIAIR